MPEKILEVKNLEVKIQKRAVLAGVNFEVNAGETVALLGLNGAGKSTIAKVLMGDPSLKIKGEVWFDGKKLNRLSPDKRAKLGIFVSQQNPVEIPGLSTTEMLREALSVREGREVSLDETRVEITKAAKRIGLDIWFAERQLNQGMSGGEKKKNEILQMLVLKPKLAVLDEIDSGLDVDATKRISKVLADFQKETGVTYIIITHNNGLLKRMRASRTMVLAQGAIVKQGGAKLASTIARDGYKAIFDDGVDPENDAEDTQKCEGVQK